MSESQSHTPSFSLFYEAMIINGVEQRSWADCCVCHETQRDESGTAFTMSDRLSWFIVCAACLPRLVAKIPRPLKERIGPSGEIRQVLRADGTVKLIILMDTAADQRFLTVLAGLAAAQRKR